MIKVYVPTTTEVEEIEVFNITDFPYDKLKININSKSRKKIEYVDYISSFDIETTSINSEKPYGYMYIWQFCLGGIVCTGRTWKEYVQFVETISGILELSETRRLVVYVHNLSFEFQFMRNFFEWQTLFAKEKRKVLYAVDNNNIEYRCSYFLSNMSLDRFVKYSGKTKYVKQDGIKFDYTKIRTPETKLTNYELAYCICDVLALCESLQFYLESDTLATIPLTNTGFVRRDCRVAMKSNSANYKMFQKTALTEKTYLMLKNAFRGGNTHANRGYVNMTLKNIHNVDVASSYPYVMMCKYYPMGKFTEIGKIKNRTELYGYLNKYCCLFNIVLENVELKDNVPIPYIAVAKCLKHKNILNYSGRVLSADYIMLTITEIDYEIIERQYVFDNLYISDFNIAPRGELPRELKKEIMDYYKGKTTLKNDDYYLYMKSKNKLNSIYGMGCTDIVHSIIRIEGNEWKEDKSDIEEELEKYYRNRNNFLPYQWGTWVTAHARKHLQKAIDIAGDSVAYCDTDSVKSCGAEIDYSELNSEIRKEVENCGAYVDYNGKRYYMGVFEKEDDYGKFKTLGAKKYVYEIDGELHITIAGVPKDMGCKELKQDGGIDAFKIGYCFSRSGKLESHYNDCDIHTIKVDGVEIVNGSNIALLPTTYTVGVTKEFAEITGIPLAYLT